MSNPVRYRWLVVFLAVVSVLASAAVSDAAVSVRGYTRKDGTYVRPHYRSNPNSSFSDNWSTKGNQNPYTGAWGTRVSPPSGVRTSGRTYARNTARSSARTTARTVTGYDYESGSWEEAANEPIAGASPQELDPTAVETANAEAQNRLTRGESYEQSGDYVAATQDYVSVVRLWPLSKDAAKAREHALRLRENEPYRTWRSRTGGYSVEAKFLREADKRVELETIEGKSVRIEFSKLSAMDQVYVLTRRKRL